VGCKKSGIVGLYIKEVRDMEHTRNKEIIEELYDLYVDDIFRFIYVRTKNRDKAKDMTQDTFARIWKSYLQKGEVPEQPRALLYTIAKNLIINYYSREKVHDSLDILFEEGIDLADTHSDMEDSMNQDQVKRVLELLPEKERSYLVLRYLDGLSIKEIAAVSEVTENVVSVTIYRAQKNSKRPQKKKRIKSII